MNPLSIIAGLWRRRDVLAQFTVRAVELRHRGSVLGLAWTAFRPLLILALYLVVFGFVFNGRFGVIPGETRTDYTLALFTGLTVFNLLAEVLAASPTLIVSQPNFVKKVVFPLEVLPAAAVASSVFQFAVSLATVVAGIALIGRGVGPGILWIPVIVAPLVLLALGIGWTLSAAGVFLRDLGNASEFLVTTLMFLSGVMYSPARLPHPLWAVLRFNPVLQAIDLCRDALFWGRPVNPLHLAYVYACGLAAFAGGHALFQRLRPAFADVL